MAPPDSQQYKKTLGLADLLVKLWGVPRSYLSIAATCSAVVAEETFPRGEAATSGPQRPHIEAAKIRAQSPPNQRHCHIPLHRQNCHHALRVRGLLNLLWNRHKRNDSGKKSNSSLGEINSVASGTSGRSLPGRAAARQAV